MRSLEQFFINLRVWKFELGLISCFNFLWKALQIVTKYMVFHFLRCFFQWWSFRNFIFLRYLMIFSVIEGHIFPHCWLESIFRWILVVQFFLRAISHELFTNSETNFQFFCFNLRFVEFFKIKLFTAVSTYGLSQYLGTSLHLLRFLWYQQPANFARFSFQDLKHQVFVQIWPNRSENFVTIFP